MSLDSFKNVSYKYIWQNLALNNPQGLICHKTQPTNLTSAEVVIILKMNFSYEIIYKLRKMLNYLVT